ncbi:MAG: helicase HerA-like domain-containing protein [Alphaproteobacteria bacterium]
MPETAIFLGAVSTGSGPDDGGPSPQLLQLKYANRHGLIAGATGTGKTVTLQVLAQGFAELGVPVFAPDMKGDLAGIAQAGTMKDALAERARAIGLADYRLAGCTVCLWDLFARQGLPIRTTISEMGPLLLGRLMALNDVQSGVLDIAFKVADEEGLLILDLKDLRAVLAFLADNAQAVSAQYGNVTRASVGSIQRQLLSLEAQGAEGFFGEPALEFADLMRTDAEGRGVVNILAADGLLTHPKLYATFLLWLMSELFEQLPEVGDPEKPKLVFFFDEAHMLFDDAPKALVDKIELMVRLIRSKGVSVWFVTQSPLDIPESVLGQLGNRVQHALRAFTPADKRAVAAVGDTFRQNPGFAAAEVIPELGIGEALVSTLGAKGIPSVVERVLIRPPSSRMGPISEDERRAAIAASGLGPKYATEIDRDSAHEMLQRRAAGHGEVQPPADGGWGGKPIRRPADGWGRAAEARPTSRSGNRQGVGEAFAKSVVRSAGSQIGRQVVRGLLGSLFGR